MKTDTATLPLPYKAIEFACRLNVSTVESYLSRRPEKQLESIKSVRITREKHYNSLQGLPIDHYRNFKFLAKLPNMEQVTIVLGIHEDHHGAAFSRRDVPD